MAVETSELLVGRVQELTAALEQVGDPEARAVADELVGSVMQLYGEGLERIFAALARDDADLPAVRSLLVEDGVVASLMLIHGLYPVDLQTRVHEALETVRPYMESHGGDVELVGIEDGVARLRLTGHCRGCPASEATLELAIKTALDEAAPDLLGLEVEGVRAPAPDLPAPGGFALPVIAASATAAAPIWTELALAGPAVGCTAPVSVQRADLLLANVGGTVLAYRNACGGCAARLDEAAMTPSGILTCPSCERRFELRRAGRSPENEGLQIAPVPLLRGGDGLRVAVPG